MARRRGPSGNALRAAVVRRARSRCEYCHAPQRICGYQFHLDHVLPFARGGSDGLENRALACASCNLAKTDRVAGPDPVTGTTVALFDPRAQVGEEHFRWHEDRTTLVGLTPAGRATVLVVDANNPFRLEARRLWFLLGLLP